MGAPCLGGGAGGEEGGAYFAAAGEREVGEFEGGGGNGWDLLPVGDGSGSFAV